MGLVMYLIFGSVFFLLFLDVIPGEWMSLNVSLVKILILIIQGEKSASYKIDYF